MGKRYRAATAEVTEEQAKELIDAACAVTMNRAFHKSVIAQHAARGHKLSVVISDQSAELIALVPPEAGEKHLYVPIGIAPLRVSGTINYLNKIREGKAHVVG